MRDLGTIEFAYTITKNSSMKEVFEYYKILNRFIDERLQSMGISPGRVRIDKIGIRDGMVRYSITERNT